MTAEPLCRAFLIPVLVILAGALPAQDPQIFPGLDAGPSHRIVDAPLVEWNGWLYYPGRSAATGVELYRCPVGSVAPPQLVVDLAPGVVSSGPAHLRVLNNELFFFADDGKRGVELWASNGSAQGTRLVRDIGPGTAGCRVPGSLTLGERTVLIAGNRLFFVADDGQTGAELWVSDGTTAGTHMLRDIAPGSAPASISELAALGSRVVFPADDLALRDLWISDGTSPGTQRVVGAGQPARTPNPTGLVTLGNQVWFAAGDTTPAGLGLELAVSDGSAAGTRVVADLVPGSQGSTPRAFVQLGVRILFVTADALYSSGGTAQSTVIVRSFAPGFLSGSAPLLGFGGRIVFSVYESGVGLVPWVSDGSTAGTQSLQAVVGGPKVTLGASPSYQLGGSPQLAVVGTRLFYGGLDAAGGHELWVSDGTAPGSGQVADLLPGVRSSVPRSLLPISGGRLAFVADDVTGAHHVFVSQGTGASTQTHATNFASWGEHRVSPAASGLQDLDGRLLFAARDPLRGYELHVSDGTRGGTGLFADLAPGVADAIHNENRSGGYPISLSSARAAGRTWFHASDGSGFGLWSTDGTTTGTRKVRSFAGQVAPWDFAGVGLRGELYYHGRDQGQDGLWVSGGQATNTRLLQAGMRPQVFARLGPQVLFFAGNSLGWVEEWWRADHRGAQKILDVGFRGVHQVRVGARMVVMGVGSKDTKIYSVGLQGAPLLLASLPLAGGVPSGYYAGDVQNMLGDGVDHALVPVPNPVGGMDLWRTDGSLANTRRVRAAVAPAQGALHHFTRVGDRVFFASTAPGGHAEVWVSDGTGQGTRPVLALTASTRQSVIPPGPHLGSFLAVGSRRLMFTHRGASLEGSVWITDGTAAGTQPALREAWRYQTMAVQQQRMVAGRWFGETSGRIHSMAFEGLATVVGEGCAASGFAPRLRSDDPVLGSQLDFELGEAQPSTIGMLAIGIPSPVRHLGSGCSLHFDPSLASYFPLLTDLQGSWSLPGIPVPALPSLQGQRLAVQVGLRSPASAPLGLDLSNGVLLILGN